MFFDSELETKTRVNLRGSGQKEEDKKSFIERTRIERERRKELKKRETSSLRIQASWRAHRALRSVRDKERLEFDEIIGERMETGEGDVVVDTAKIDIMLRKFLFFFSEDKDAVRLDRMCAILLDNIKKHFKSSDPSVNFVYIESKEKMAKRIFQVKTLLSYSTKRLLSNMGIHLQILLHLTNPNLFIFSSPLPPNSAMIASTKITSFLVRKGFYGHIHQLLLRFEPSTAQAPENVLLMQYFFTLILRPLQYHTVGQSQRDPQAALIHISFISDILSVHLLTQRLPTQVIALFATTLPIVLSIDPSKLHIVNTRTLLENICNLWPAVLQSTQAAAKGEKSQQSLMPYIRFTDRLVQSISLQSPFSDSTQDVDLLRQIRVLSEPNTVSTLWKVFLPASLEPSSSAMTSISSLPEGLLSLCRLYMNFLSWSTFQGNSSFLNTLVYQTPLIRRLWRILVNSKELKELEKSGASEDKPELCTILMLFAKCYSHLLLTIDDKEFFEEQKYFKLTEVESMVRTLKEIVFANYWNVKEAAFIKDRSKQAFRETITTLLKLLYDRNSRHAFCHANCWIASQFPSQVNTSDEKVKQILQLIPFVVSFTQRVKIFYDVIAKEKEVYQANPYYDIQRVRIRRDYVFEDAYADLLNIAPEKLKGFIRVELINSSGLAEAGIDGGGVFKEFFIELIKTAYNTQYGLFRETPERFLYPNPAAADFNPDAFKQFEFLGRLLGKAVYENILVELPFANFFLAKLLGKFNYVNDLVFLDPELHKNLMSLKNMEHVENLELNFTIDNTEFGKSDSHELLPGGKDITVNDENKIRYIALMAHYKLNLQIKEQSSAFLRGFSQVISTELLQMFSQDELQKIISGIPGGLNVDDMEANVVYSGGYQDDHPVVRMFWRVFRTFSPEEQRKFLMFVTSCSHPPLLGFGHLEPRLCIHPSRQPGGDDEYLPTASTCMNFFKLPPYKSEAKMREKLLYAINSRSGFELS